MHLECPDGPDNDGAFALAWSGDAARWRVEENGAVVYEGADLATTLTGRPRGMYEYRVGSVADGDVTAWSAPCSIEVAPPSLALAFTLAAVGAAVFAATLWLVLSGARDAREDTR